MSLPERQPVLDVVGPLTVKEVEHRVFHAARSHHQFEASHRTWLEEDRSFFIRWHDSAPDSPLVIIGLVQVTPLPEMASQVRLLPFDEEAAAPLKEALVRYAELLHKKLETEGFR